MKRLILTEKVYLDLQSGKGKEIFEDGSEYTGTYMNGKKHGKGKYMWSDSSLYEGDFKQDFFEGKYEKG